MYTWGPERQLSHRVLHALLKPSTQVWRLTTVHYFSARGSDAFIWRVCVCVYAHIKFTHNHQTETSQMPIIWQLTQNTMPCTHLDTVGHKREWSNDTLQCEWVLKTSCKVEGSHIYTKPHVVQPHTYWNVQNWLTHRTESWWFWVAGTTASACRQGPCSGGHGAGQESRLQWWC